MRKIIITFLAGLFIWPFSVAASTGCNYPTSLDVWSDKIAGDFLTIADVNQFRCAIEKLESGPLRPNDGSAVAPAYAFRTSAGAGMYLSAADQLDFVTAGVSRFRINSSGHLLAVADATYDIGLAGANRPRDIRTTADIYVGGELFVGNTASTGVGANSIVLKNNGQIQWVNAAGTTTADLAILFTPSDHLKFIVPAAANLFSFFHGATEFTNLVAQQSGAGLKMKKADAAQSAPGAGFGQVAWRTGTNLGTLKLVAIAGTNNTEVTIVDNVGAGN